MGELAWRAFEWEVRPRHLTTVWWHVQRGDVPPRSLCHYDRQKRCPCSLPVGALRRAGPAPHLGSTIELVLDVEAADELSPTPWGQPRKASPSLVCWAVSWKREICPPPLWPSMASGRVGLRVTRVGELTISLTSCNTQEDRPCPSPRQQGRAGSGWGVAGELALGV